MFSADRETLQELVERCKQEIAHCTGGVTETPQGQTGPGEINASSGGMSLCTIPWFEN